MSDTPRTDALAEANAIIKATLRELPVGNVREHTPESIPGRVADLVAENAEISITKSEWVALQKEWFGDKYAAMQPADAVQSRCSDDAERIDGLERELAEQVLCNGKGAEREADLRGKVERLERENAKLLRVADLARDAVESGSVEECYLSLLRDVLAELPNAPAEPRR